MGKDDRASPSATPKLHECSHGGVGCMGELSPKWCGGPARLQARTWPTADETSCSVARNYHILNEAYYISRGGCEHHGCELCSAMISFLLMFAGVRCSGGQWKSRAVNGFSGFPAKPAPGAV